MKRKCIIRAAMIVGFVGLSIGGWAATKVQGQSASTGISIPSGQPVTFLQFISEGEGSTSRFRFLTPGIGADLEYEDVFDDFQALCDEQVMPAIIQNSLHPQQIVLSMSAVDIPFGGDDPAVLQFFEVFRPENGRCIWEEF